MVLWVSERTKVHIVFDGPPGPEAGRFIETETESGQGIGIGEWIVREDGNWALVIEVPTDTVRVQMKPLVEPHDHIWGRRTDSFGDGGDILTCKVTGCGAVGYD